MNGKSIFCVTMFFLFMITRMIRNRTKIIARMMFISILFYFFFIALSCLLLHFLQFTSPFATFMLGDLIFVLHLLHTKTFVYLLLIASGNFVILYHLFLFSFSFDL